MDFELTEDQLEFPRVVREVVERAPSLVIQRNIVADRILGLPS